MMNLECCMAIKNKTVGNELIVRFQKSVRKVTQEKKFYEEQHMEEQIWNRTVQSEQDTEDLLKKRLFCTREKR